MKRNKILKMKIETSLFVVGLFLIATATAKRIPDQVSQNFYQENIKF